MEMTIHQAASLFEIRELAIWVLIRQNEIKSGLNCGEVVVNGLELQRFIDENPEKIELLRMNPTRWEIKEVSE